MAVTLAEIAALAGVSRGTVDRALNDRGRVDPKVAARVRRIAAERGYRPNRAGRMLARAKNPIRIGVIVQSVETMFMHTVFEEIERASAHFTTTGAEVLVRPLEGIDAQQQLDVIDELLEAGVQGIALSPAEDERIRADRNIVPVFRSCPGACRSLPSTRICRTRAACAMSAWTISRADA